MFAVLSGVSEKAPVDATAPMPVHPVSTLFQPPSCSENSPEGAFQSNESVSRSLDSASLSVSTFTSVETRPQSPVGVQPYKPRLLPCLAIGGVGMLMVISVVAVTTYELHEGGAIIAFFGRSVTLLRSRNGSSLNDVSSGVNSSHLMRHEINMDVAETDCKTDLCDWTQSYLRGRLNSSVSPCDDFYGHVCSAKWVERGLDVQSRSYRERTSGMMMLDVEKFFGDYLRENQERYHKLPGVFLHQAITLMSKCRSEEKDDNNLTSMRSLLEDYNLGSWPYRRAPRGVSIVHLVGVSGPRPRTFENDREYTVHIDAPSLTLKRYNLAYLDDSPENFTAKVALVLSLFGSERNVTGQAEGLALLEEKLHSITAATRPTEFPNRLKRVEDLNAKGKWDWKVYLNVLFQDIEPVENDKPVAIVNPEYVSKMTSILNETDTLTLLNYLGYRLVVHVSPLLAKAGSPLLRLSHDNYLEFVPERLQACLHMVERMYKHGMRFFGRMTFSKNNSTLLLKHYDYSMSRLEVQIKNSMADRLLSSSSWLGRSAIGIGVDKLQSMRFVFLGSTTDINTVANYYNFNSQPLDPSRLVESYRDLQAATMSAYWESKPPKDDLDARYDHSALAPGYEYYTGRNVLFIPHSNIAFLNDLTKSIEPIFFPLILTDVLRGMFESVDRRGSEEKTNFSKLELCFQDQYHAEMSKLIGNESEARIRLEENVADNAILGPLYDMYIKNIAPRSGDERLKVTVDERQLDMEQLFFVLYAVGLCDNPNRDSWIRKLRFGEIPGKLRVNIPLKNFPKFSKAFHCPTGTPMNPTQKCTVW
ncbi:hypothetical protein HPB48_007214 [Haemaphysalis longicornis]|uniref:Uncharacterized protein n=1 Tax=Haemaphysalis longicornis TaxID=44386 RepID=A0A9J6GL11_HAELO|nr:hypothetical protein HPB48_007214 [Haemaphysalis longicornis]